MIPGPSDQYPTGVRMHTQRTAGGPWSESTTIHSHVGASCAGERRTSPFAIPVLAVAPSPLVVVPALHSRDPKYQKGRAFRHVCRKPTRGGNGDVSPLLGGSPPAGPTITAGLEHLGQLDFLHARENVILLGPPCDRCRARAVPRSDQAAPSSSTPATTVGRVGSPSPGPRPRTSSFVYVRPAVSETLS